MPIVETDHVDHTGPFGVTPHVLGASRVQRERLLAQDVLAVVGRRDGDRRVGIVRRNDVDDVDVVALDDRPPIGVGFLKAEAVGGGVRQVLGHVDDHLAAQPDRQRAGDRRHSVRETVRLAHEARADQGDP